MKPSADQSKAPDRSPRRPMVLVALVHLAGVALGWGLGVGGVAGWAALAAAAALIAWSGWRLWRARRIHGPLPGRGLAALAALALLGLWQGGRLELEERTARAALAGWPDGEPVRVIGTLAEEPRLRPGRADLILKNPRLEAMRVGGPIATLPTGVLVSVMLDQPDESLARRLPLPGRVVSAWGRLRRIEMHAPAPFDMETYWNGRGVGARVLVQRLGDLEVARRDAHAMAPAEWRRRAGGVIRGVRLGAIERLRRHLSADQVPLARALLLGEVWQLDLATADAFRRSGLAHLMAVSGLHTSLIAALLFLLARVARLRPWPTTLLVGAGLLLFAALTAFQASVVRATVMAIFVVLGLALRRQATAQASLATALFATLVIDPRNLLRVDWQLSFTCVASIVLLVEPLFEAISPRRKDKPAQGPPDPPAWWRRLLDLALLLPLATVLAVQAGLMPLQLAYFRQWHALNPLANLVGVPASTGAMAGLLGVAALGWIPGVGWLFGCLAEGFMEITEQWARLCAWVPLSYTGRPLAWGWLWVYYGVLLTGPHILRGRGPGWSADRVQRLAVLWRGAAVVAILLWAPLAGRGVPRAVASLRATGAAENMVGARSPLAGGLDLFMLDVGQGDALVLRGPGGQVLVVDAGRGGRADQGRLTLAPFLQSLGAPAIDCLVATHADGDHIGGMTSLLRAFPVRLLIEGPDTSSSEGYRELREEAARRGVPRRRVQAGTRLAGLDPAEVTLLGPVKGADDNNASIVLWARLGAADLLLTGDLEAEGERRLAKAGLLRDIEVLKLGHHGSRSSTSPELLAACRPEVALVSAGRNNRYGHPAADVLRRAAEAGAAIFRTDLQGTIWVHTDGRRVEVYRFAGP